MRFIIVLPLAIAALGFSTSGFAAEGTFCDGYKEGYTSVPGFENVDPVCPPDPVMPAGERPILIGIAAGMAAAKNEN